MKNEYFKEEKSEDDMNIYSRELREILLEDDELSPMEDAFIQGYDEAI